MNTDFKTSEKCDLVCAHIANGGSLVDLCTLENIRFSDLVMWLNEKEQKKRYIAALTAQTEWAIQKILTELRTISFSDTRELFEDDGTLKQVKDWPEGVSKRINSIQVLEEFEGTGRERTWIGYTKKVKLVDKLKAIEMLMKNMGMLTERTLNLHLTPDDKEFRDEFFGVNKTGE